MKQALFAVLSLICFSFAASGFAQANPQANPDDAANATDSSIELSEAEAVGRRIKAVLFKRVFNGLVTNAPPQSVRVDQASRDMRMQVGDVLREGDLEADLDYLLRSACYFERASVTFTASDSQPGTPVEITLACVEPRIADIQVLAPRGGWFEPAGGALTNETMRILRLRVGDPYSIDSVDQDIQRKLSVDERFISIEEVREYKPDGVHITMRVIPARIVDRVVLSGLDGLDADDSVDTERLKTVTSAGPSTRAAIKRDIKQAYLKKGYPFVDVRHRIVVIPPTGEVTDLAKVYPDLTDRELEDIDDEGRASETVLLIQIDEGPRVQVANITFEGIDSLVDVPGSDALEPGTLPTSLWPLWYAVPFIERKARVERALYLRMANGKTLFTPMPDFDMEAALQDAVFLEEHLQKAGWRNARVTLQTILYNEDRSRVELSYRVEPGALYAITAVALRVVTRAPLTNPAGDPVQQAVSNQEIWEALDYGDASAEKGLPEAGLSDAYTTWRLPEPVVFEEFAFDGDPLDPGRRGKRREIQALFGKHGYSNIRFTLQEVASPPGTRLDPVPKEFADQPGGVVGTVIVLDIDQHHRYRVGEIKVEGNRETQTSVIRRVMQLVPGEDFDIEQMRRAEDRLRANQWFDASTPGAGVRIVPSYQPDPAGGTILEEDYLLVDLLVTVIEGATGSINFAAAYSPQSGATVTISLSKRNFDIADWPGFTGAGQNFSISVEPKLAERERYSVSFSEPYLWGYPLSGSIEVSVGSQEYNSFTRKEQGGRIGIGYTLVRDFDLIWRYQYFEDEILDVDPGASFQLRRQIGKTRLSAFSLEGVYRTLNRRIFPTGGLSASLEGLVASEAIGGSYDMWRLTAKYQHAFLLHEIDDTRTIALNLRGASIWQRPWGNTSEIPLSQKQFLGSIGTPLNLRGYRRQGVGPVAGEDRIGGDFVIGGTAEVSFELQSAFFWIVGFVDAGQLVQDIDNFDPEGFSSAYGFGIRIQLPVFPTPLGIDFGWPLRNQPSNDLQRVALNLQVGF